jgi:hypothetical protein
MAAIAFPTVLEEAVNGMAVAGGYSSIVPYVGNTMVPYGERAIVPYAASTVNSAVNYLGSTLQSVGRAAVPFVNAAGYVGAGMGVLRGLIDEASSLGESFSNFYHNTTSGRSYTNDVAQFYTSVHDSTQSPETVYQACTSLADDIKRALEAARATNPPPVVPGTCVSGQMWACDDIYVNDRKADVKRLHEEIERLTCQLQGKIQEKERVENTLNNCVMQLEKIDTTCKNSAGGTCPFAPGGGASPCAGGTCPFAPAGTPETAPCACQLPPPPPPVEEETKVCSCKRANPKPKKPRPKKKRSTTKCELERLLEEYGPEALYDLEYGY